MTCEKSFKRNVLPENRKETGLSSSIRFGFDGTIQYIDRKVLEIFGLDEIFPIEQNLVKKKLSDIVLINPEDKRVKKFRDLGLCHNSVDDYKDFLWKEKWISLYSFLITDFEIGEEAVHFAMSDAADQHQFNMKIDRENYIFRGLIDYLPFNNNSSDKECIQNNGSGKIFIINYRVSLTNDHINILRNAENPIEIKDSKKRKTGFVLKEEFIKNLMCNIQPGLIQVKIGDRKIHGHSTPISRILWYGKKSDLNVEDSSSKYCFNSGARDGALDRPKILVARKVITKEMKLISLFSSLVLLILLFPISFLLALVHKIESRGPLFYIQKRMGLRGKEFNLIKFRTMVKNAEKDGLRFAHDNDCRITKIGKIMRKFHFDEVPQFINILKGDLNLIGPRPERKEVTKILGKEIPLYEKRLEVRPGLTGWAQVKYRYAGNCIDDHIKKLEYDLFYIKNKSLVIDALIVLKTTKAVLGRSGT